MNDFAKGFSHCHTFKVHRGARIRKFSPRLARFPLRHYAGSMISLGIIGPGLIWENTHRDILADLSDLFQVRACAARSDQNQQRARSFYPKARIYSDANALITDPEVEAVVILTPISLNAPMAKAALQAGKHAIVEKPLARSVSEAQDVISAAGQGPGELYVLEQHVHKKMISTVRDLIDRGEIGTPVSFERSLHVRIDDADDQTGGYGGTDWRKTPDYPLGNFFDGGIHELALLQELFGAVEAVYSRGRSLREGFGDVDLLSMVLEYARDVHGVFAHSAFLGRQGNSLVIHGTTAALDCSDREIRRIDATTGEVSPISVDWKDESHSMWEEVAAVVSHQGPGPRYYSAKAVNDLATLEALQASLESGNRTVVPR